jgi:hypothetical protein
MQAGQNVVVERVLLVIHQLRPRPGKKEQPRQLQPVAGLPDYSMFTFRNWRGSVAAGMLMLTLMAWTVPLPDCVSLAK